MKKIIIISLTLILAVGLLSVSPVKAETKATGSKTTALKSQTSGVKKAPAKAAVKPAPLKPVKWAASGLSAVSSIPKGVRPAYKKKVENYARRNNIKLITKQVVNSMRE